MLNLASSTRTASSTVGISGTSISSTFDGRCVKTIVLISPIRAAIRAAAQRRHRRQDVRPEEDRAEDRLGHAEPLVEPEREEALDDQAAAEGIEREQRGQPPDDAARPMEAEPPGDRRVGGRNLDGRRRPTGRSATSSEPATA